MLVLVFTLCRGGACCTASGLSMRRLSHAFTRLSCRWVSLHHSSPVPFLQWGIVHFERLEDAQAAKRDLDRQVHLAVLTFSICCRLIHPGGQLKRPVVDLLFRAYSAVGMARAADPAYTAPSLRRLYSPCSRCRASAGPEEIMPIPPLGRSC